MEEVFLQMLASCPYSFVTIVSEVCHVDQSDVGQHNRRPCSPVPRAKHPLQADLTNEPPSSELRTARPPITPNQTSTRTPAPRPPPSPPRAKKNAMASRRLALNVQQALRSKTAINAVKSSRLSPLTRGLATPVLHGSKTESTTLSNGFTVGWPLCPRDAAQLTDLRRSLPSTPHGPRRRPSACGSMLEAAPRRTRPMEPHTSWSTLPSRYVEPSALCR